MSGFVCADCLLLCGRNVMAVMCRLVQWSVLWRVISVAVTDWVVGGDLVSFLLGFKSLSIIFDTLFKHLQR